MDRRRKSEIYLVHKDPMMARDQVRRFFETQATPDSVALWRIDGIEEGASSGPVSIFAITAGPAEVPDPNVAITEASGNEYIFTEIFRIALINSASFYDEGGMNLLRVDGAAYFCSNQSRGIVANGYALPLAKLLIDRQRDARAARHYHTLYCEMAAKLASATGSPVETVAFGLD